MTTCPDYEHVKDLPIRQLTSFLRSHDDELEWYIQSMRSDSRQKIKKLTATSNNSSKKQVKSLNLESQLTSNVLHDIKNPLSVIGTASKILRLKNKSNDLSIIKNLDAIDRSTGRILDQIQSTLRHPKNNVQLETCSLENIVNTSMQSLVIPPGVTIHIPKSTTSIISDTSFLQSIFSNIILNAIQAMNGKGQIKIAINDNKNHVSIIFEDSGPGIPPSYMAQIFKPYFTTKEHGTGWGLSNVKSIVEQLGGQISAKNNPTRFSIQLPKDRFQKFP